MHPVSPIAVVTVLTAAIAVAVVVAFQGEDASRVRVVDAQAVPDDADASALRLYMTVINDGGDDHVVDFRSPASPEVVLVAGARTAEDAPPAPLALPADSTEVLGVDYPYLVAHDVDRDQIGSDGFPLVIELAHSDGIYVTIPLQDQAE